MSKKPQLKPKPKDRGNKVPLIQCGPPPKVTYLVIGEVTHGEFDIERDGACSFLTQSKENVEKTISRWIEEYGFDPEDIRVFKLEAAEEWLCTKVCEHVVSLVTDVSHELK